MSETSKNGTQPGNIIEVQSLKKSFGKITAVDGLSFSVCRGGLFAFLGLNGAGKSTTINIICSILKKDGGKVFIDGLDADKHSGDIKKLVGIVFQDSVLDRFLTVKENLFARAALYGMTKKETAVRISELSDSFGLSEILARPFKNLSGGQRRRVDIARALLHKPKLLILDEPTTGLDPRTRMNIWSVIEEFRANRELTVFLTTHYMEEAVRADTVVIIDAGKKAAEGSPDFLKNKYTTDFLRVIRDRDEGFEKTLGADSRKFDYRNNSYYVSVASGADALGYIEKRRGDIPDFEILKGGMDDVFLSVTGKKLENVEEA